MHSHSYTSPHISRDILPLRPKCGQFSAAFPSITTQRPPPTQTARQDIRLSWSSRRVICPLPSLWRQHWKQELSSCWDGRPFSHNRHGPKSGGAAVPLSVGELGPHLTQ